MSGQVQLSSDLKSYAQYYDAAGNAVLHQRLGGGDLMSTRQDYDARGQLIRQWYEVDTTAGQTSLGVQETRTYDAAGRLLTRNDFVRSDRIATWTTADGPDALPVGGYLYQATVSTYDTDGRLTDQVTYARDSATWYIGVARQLDNGTTTEAEQRTPPSTPPSPDSTTYGALDTVQSALRGQQYDAAGNVSTYLYVVPNQFQNTYTLSYLKRDGYLEQSTAGTSSTAGYAPATTTSSYDAWGRLTKVQEHITPPAGVSQPNDSVRYFADNGDGQIVSRRDGELTSGGSFTQDPDGTALPSYVATGVDIDRAAAIGAKNVHYTYVAGQQVAHQDEAGLLEVAGVPSPTEASDAGSSGSYVVQAGDTLSGIAQRVYGNASLWYVIADANALDGNPDDALTAGIQLTLPSVSVDRNDAQTFKPYHPAEIVGSTTPSLPYIPPPPSQHCNTLAMIVIIAVVIVATVMTAGAAAVAAGASGSLWTAGSAVLLGEGGLTAASLGAAALGGFAGSVAGQLTGKALGVQDHFSLRQAVGAGVGAAITAGLGHFATGGQTIETLKDAKNFAGYARIAGTGAAGTLGSYAGNRLVGEEAHFNWANLVASSVSAAATARLGLPTGEQQAAGQGAPGFWTNVEGNLVQDTIGAGIDRALGADASNSRQIVEDAFGNALANSWGQGIQNYLDGWSADHAATVDIEAPQVTIDRPTLQVNDLVPDRLAGPTFVGESSSGNAAFLSADGGTRTEEVTLADGRRVRATVAVGDITPGPTSADQAQWAQGYDQARESAQATRDYVAMQWKRSQETLATWAREEAFRQWERQDSIDLLSTFYVKAPLDVGIGIAKDLGNSIPAMAQWIGKGLQMYAAADLEQGALISAATGHEEDAARGYNAAARVRADVQSTPIVVPFEETPMQRAGATAFAVMSLGVGAHDALPAAVGWLGRFGQAERATDTFFAATAADRFSYVVKTLPNDLVADSRGVYGYLPVEGSQFAPPKWPVDWTNPEQVAAARGVRLDYHQGLADEVAWVSDMRARGASDEDIARQLVDIRNQSRMSKYSEDQLPVLYERNTQTYGNKYGPSYDSQLAKYGSPQGVIAAGTRSNLTMDILTGIAKVGP